MSTTNRVQWIFYRTDFSGLPTGNQLITKIYLRSGTTIGSAVFTNLTIRMGHTNLTTFTSGAYITGLTTVLSSTSYSATSIVAGGWVEFALQTPFTYNGTQNIAVEVSQTAYTGGFTVRQNTAGGNRRLFGTVVSTTGTASTGIADFGMDEYPKHACTKPTSLPTININSNAARVRWNTVSGAVSYDYRISTSPVWPSTGWTNTTANSHFVQGLMPSTLYYLHVRSRCSATTFSFWDTISFRTLPPCNTPNGFKVVRLDSNSADISWRKSASSQIYEYLVDRTRAIPLSSEHSLAIITTDSNAKLNSLMEATKYYVHLRSKCAGNDSSNWSLDSFTTPLGCKSPKIDVNVLNNTSAILLWDTIKTSYQYEYYNSLTPDIPSFGTPIKTNTILINTLQPNYTYYIHARAVCEDQNVKANSPWVTLNYSTTQLNVNTANVRSSGYSIYPNPVTNTLYLNNKNNIDPNTSVSIIDIYGRVIMSMKITDNLTLINTGDLPSGRYFIKISQANEPILLQFSKL
jgi:hypothetical protein